VKTAIYARVSTDEQTTDNQVIELKKVAERNGWEIETIYADTISGAKSKRPQLDKLMKAIMRKEIDMVMVWSVDRLGRSLQHLTTLLSDIHSKGVDLYLHQQGIDTTTPSGKMMFQMCGVFAEFERSLIRERVMAGLERARSQGKRLGRPPVPPILIEKMKCMRQEGMTLTAIAKKVGVSVGKVHQCV
jgi:DNA invertase Pin-like site-specific DNA recombinase|tara:strand:- start:1172 stop:1735 length:564 start_codon:yes stop_codon:yes gene_type:complete